MKKNQTTNEASFMDAPYVFGANQFVKHVDQQQQHFIQRAEIPKIEFSAII